MDQIPQWRPEPECYRAALPLNFPPEANFIYRSTNNMTPVLPGSSVHSADSFDADLPSHDVVVVGDAGTSDYLLVGALTAHRSQTYFTVRRRSGRLHSIAVAQPSVKPGEKPEELLVKSGSDWRELLKFYAEESARRMGVKPVSAETNLAGYCSWYYYYADVTERDFLDNLEALAARSDSPYSSGIAQIDDGYQTFQGDWLDQDASWPTPLAEIARNAASKGLTPGIWLMPMLASTASRTFREHPEYFVCNEKGEPLVFAGWSPAPDNHWACLDATQHAVRDHLTHVFKTFRSWGFRYFKLDGLGYGLPEGRRQDAGATAVSAFRLALKTIREAVPDAFILGCCPPFMACLGYVDACRVSCDTSRYWFSQDPRPLNCDNSPGLPGIRNAWHGTIMNWWMFDRWFRADPDTVMARQDNAFYTLGEARISTLAAILTGVSITSDHLGTIAPERYRLLELAASLRLRDAAPARWEPFRWPQVFTGTVDGRKAAAFVNDTGQEMTFELSEGMLNASAEEVLIGLGRISGPLTLPPRDAALLIE